MLSGLNYKKFIYILSNLFVLPTIFIPNIDFVSNLSFLFAFFTLFRTNTLLVLILAITLIIKNNANYRFNLLLKLKGSELSKSDYQCVQLYAWCTLLRYFLIGIAVNQIFLYLK